VTLSRLREEVVISSTNDLHHRHFIAIC
jgi:hypothetical protein